MLLLPLVGNLLLARGSLCPLCLLHGPPLLISGCWALHSPAFSHNLISCLLGSADPSFFEQPNFMSSARATRNAGLYFFYLTCEFSSRFARYVLVLLWLPPFPVLPHRLSSHYGTGFYGVACQLHAVSL